MTCHRKCTENLYHFYTLPAARCRHVRLAISTNFGRRRANTSCICQVMAFPIIARCFRPPAPILISGNVSQRQTLHSVVNLVINSLKVDVLEIRIRNITRAEIIVIAHYAAHKPARTAFVCVLHDDHNNNV